MKEFNLKNTLVLWIALVNYLGSNPLIGKDAVQLAVYRLESKLEQAGICNVVMLFTSEFSYTLQYECEGLQIVTQLAKEKVDSVDVKQILKL